MELSPRGAWCPGDFSQRCTPTDAPRRSHIIRPKHPNGRRFCRCRTRRSIRGQDPRLERPTGEFGVLVVETIARRVKAAKHLLILFRFRDKNSRPIRRRHTYLKSLYACPVQIKEHPKAEIILGRPTQLVRLQRTFPIAASITVNHGRP